MDKKIIVTNNAPAAIGPYSQAVAYGNLIFTSGQLPINPSTGELILDIRKATEECIKNISEILKSEGSDLTKVIKTVVFVKDLKDFAAVNEVYGKFFTSNQPARSCVEVARLPKDAPLEMEAVAYI